MFVERRERKLEIVLPPKSVQFVVEKGCYLGCPFCDQPSSSRATAISQVPKDDSREAEVAFLEKRKERFANALAILDPLKIWGVSQVTFTGGEPTLFPHIDKLLKEAKARGIRTALATNGLSTVFFPRSWTTLENGFLTPNLLDKMAPHLDVLKLPMHGADAKTHDGIVQMRGSFALIALTLLERQKYYVRDFGAEVTCVVTEENLEQLGMITNICCALDVGQLTFSQIYPRGRGVNCNRIPFERIQQLVKDLEAKKRDQLKEEGMRLVVRRLAPSCVLVYPDGEVKINHCPAEKTGTSLVGNLMRGNIAEDWKTFPLREAYEIEYRKNQAC